MSETFPASACMRCSEQQEGRCIRKCAKSVVEWVSSIANAVAHDHAIRSVRRRHRRNGERKTFKVQVLASEAERNCAGGYRNADAAASDEEKENVNVAGSGGVSTPAECHRWVRKSVRIQANLGWSRTDGWKRSNAKRRVADAWRRCLECRATTAPSNRACVDSLERYG